VCLQINTVKYDANQEITNIYENLQIVWSKFCTDKLLFVYIRSTSNIYWFIGIQIRCQQIQMNSYSVTFGYTQYLVLHLLNDPEGKKTTICCYLSVTIKSLAVFTILHFLHNLWMDPIDYSVALHLAGKTCQGQAH
jgi:hypothetical protein